MVPRPEPRYQQLTTFIYLSDVTEEDGPTRIVPYEDGKDVPYTPLYMPFGSLADVEVACTGPAGSLLVYRTDILHRGSDMTGVGRSRFSILADFQVRGTTWGGKMAWPKQSPERWARFIPQCSVRERDLFGFPRPGDPYWSEETLEGVAARYPGIDLEPYRNRSGVTESDRGAGRAPACLRRPSRPTGGTRVLVDRLWPRGIAKAAAPFDEWSKDVAPSTELRRWYGHDPAKFEEFAGATGTSSPPRPQATASSVSGALAEKWRDRPYHRDPRRRALRAASAP